MFQQIRKSSRGNPWHDQMGRFCSGPDVKELTRRGILNPDNTVADTKGLEAAMQEYPAHEYWAQSTEDYNVLRTNSRFNEPASKKTRNLTEFLCNKLNLDMPKDTSEHSLRIFNEIHQYDKFSQASEKQVKAVMHYEEDTNIPYSKNGRFGGDVGAYIGMCKTYLAMRDPDNWERVKTPNGIEYRYRSVAVIRSHNGVYSATRISHKVRDGHRNVEERMVLDGRKNPKECMKFMAGFEANSYSSDYRQFDARKRSPMTINNRLEEHERLKGEWNDNGDGTFSCGDYTVEQSEHGWRCKRNVHIDQKVRDERHNHERLEWVVSACSTKEEAMAVAVKHDKESILKKEINLKAASDREINMWKEKGWITSKTNYMHILDDLKKE